MLHLESPPNPLTCVTADKLESFTLISECTHCKFLMAGILSVSVKYSS